MAFLFLAIATKRGTVKPLLQYRNQFKLSKFDNFSFLMYNKNVCSLYDEGLLVYGASIYTHFTIKAWQFHHGFASACQSHSFNLAAAAL